MVNYQQGKIYRIVDNTNNNMYIGSTCKKLLSQRLAAHISDYKCFLNGKRSYITSFEIVKNNNYAIVLLEAYPCNSRDELLAKERFYIETNNCVNKIIPGRTDKEYRENNKDIILKYQKNFYENHKEQVKERRKLYSEKNKEAISKQKANYYQLKKQQVADQTKTTEH
jgi:hypothetical protein